MRRYLCILGILTIVMMLLSFAVKWTGMAFFEPLPVWMLPAAVLYFAVITGLQYWLTIRSMHNDPRKFINFFLGITVGVLFVHLLVLVGGMLANPASGKRFAIGFMVLYLVYTVFITASLVRFSRHAGDQPRQ